MLPTALVSLLFRGELLAGTFVLPFLATFPCWEGHLSGWGWG